MELLHQRGRKAPRSLDLIRRGGYVVPERPGALLEFLNQMGGRWNISLFHYRSHGADFGRVLVGMQVPPGEKREFNKFLKNLGYAHWDETENPAYKLFLA